MTRRESSAARDRLSAGTKGKERSRTGGATPIRKLVVGDRELAPLIGDAELFEGGDVFLRLCKCLDRLARLPSSKPRAGAMPKRTRFVMGVQVLESKLREAQQHDDLLKRAHLIGFRPAGPLRSTSALEQIFVLGECTAFALDRISKSQSAPPLMRVPWPEQLDLNRTRLRGRSDDAFAWLSKYLASVDWEKLRTSAQIELFRIEADRRHPSGSTAAALRLHQYRALVYDDQGALKQSPSDILHALLELHAHGAQPPFKLTTVAARAGCHLATVKLHSPALQSLELVAKVRRGIDITSKGREEALAGTTG